MITKIFIMLISMVSASIGLTYIIIYTNLFTFGYTIKEYIIFILKQPENYLFFIGLLIEIILVLTWKGKRK